MIAKLIALLYHEVIDENMVSGFQNKDNLVYMHKTEVFRNHINYIKKHNIITPDKFNIEYKDKANILFFTFDDGGISNNYTSTILSDNNILGLFFITTNKINTPFFLTTHNIKTIHENEHIIGSHSHTHPMIFRSLTYKQMLTEWKTSKQILEDILQKEVLFCSIPGGDSDKKTYEAAIECGYKYIFNSEPNPIPINFNNATIIGRFSIKTNTSLTDLDNIIHLKNITSLQRNRKIKNTIKKIIYPLHSYIQNKKNNA